MQIRVKIAGQETKEYSLNDDYTILGRSDECDIHIFVEGISRKHLLFTHLAGILQVQDLGSSQGSFLNGTQLEINADSHFNLGDELKLGSFVTINLLEDKEKEKTKSPTKEQFSSLNSFAQDLGTKNSKKQSKANIHIPESSSISDSTQGLIDRSATDIGNSKKSTNSRKTQGPSRKTSKKNRKNRRKSNDSVAFRYGVVALLVLAVSIGYVVYNQHKKEKLLLAQALLKKTESEKKELTKLQAAKEQSLQAEVKLKKEKENKQKLYDLYKSLILQNKCILPLEFRLCDLYSNSLIKLNRPHGFVKSLDEVILVINLKDTIEMYKKKYLANDDRYWGLVSIGRNVYGRRFSAKTFKKNNYLWDRVVDNYKSLSARALGILILAKTFENIKNSDIKKVTLLNVDKDNNVLSQFSYDFVKLRNIFKEIDLNRVNSYIVSNIFYKPLDMSEEFIYQKPIEDKASESL